MLKMPQDVAIATKNREIRRLNDTKKRTSSELVLDRQNLL